MSQEIFRALLYIFFYQSHKLMQKLQNLFSVKLQELKLKKKKGPTLEGHVQQSLKQNMAVRKIKMYYKSIVILPNL